MSSFLLNPYDATLNLADKDDRKIFQEGCKGLKDKEIFDGKKLNYGNFVKLIEPGLTSTRTMTALEISTAWDSNGSSTEAKRIPDANGIIDIFKSNKATPEEIKHHCGLVWAKTDFGADTPQYFKVFATAPTDTSELQAFRNAQQLKHVMMGNKIWESLSSPFKIDISGSKAEYQRCQENDGPLLWDFIRRRVNPTTTVGASKLKDDIEGTKVSAFDNDIVQYNTWFDDTRELIIKEEGDGYNEYLRSMFRAYLSCDDKEFADTIKDERRKWTQGKLGTSYTYRELMDLGRLTYNNLLDEGSWNSKASAKKSDEKNYLALATELMTKMKSYADRDGGPNGGVRNERQGDGERPTYLPWRFENKDNKPTKVVRGSTMNWCKNDCHEKPMWCGRKNCLNRADYSAAWQKKKDSKDSNSGNDTSSSEFRIALAAMTSPEDFEALQAQFASLKE